MSYWKHSYTVRVNKDSFLLKEEKEWQRYREGSSKPKITHMHLSSFPISSNKYPIQFTWFWIIRNKFWFLIMLTDDIHNFRITIAPWGIKRKYFSWERNRRREYYVYDRLSTPLSPHKIYLMHATNKSFLAARRYLSFIWSITFQNNQEHPHPLSTKKQTCTRWTCMSVIFHKMNKKYQSLVHWHESL